MKPDAPSQDNATPQNITATHSTVVKNSAFIVAAQGLGVIAGLGFDIVAAALFGISISMDAMFVALTVPQIIVSVFVSTSIRTLLPLFSEMDEIGGSETLAIILSSTINYIFCIQAAITVLGVLTAPWLTAFFGLPPEGQAIAIRGTQIVFLSLLPLAFIEPLRAYFVFREQFFLSTITNFLRYGTALITLLLLNGRFDIMALAWAYVAGSLAQLAVYGIAFIWLGGKYQLTFGKELDAWQQIATRLGPPIIGELVGQSNILVERFFASFLPPGMVSALGYGRRVLFALNGLVVNSVIVAILPQLARDAVTQQIERLRKAIHFGTQFIALVTGFVTISIISFSQFVVILLFQRGAFDFQAAELTAVILSIFTPALYLMGLTQLFMAPFFAFGETKIIMYLRCLFLLINFGISWLFVTLFGSIGLATALIASLVVQTTLWIYMLHRRLDGLGRPIWLDLGKFTFILLIITLGIYTINSIYPPNEQLLTLFITNTVTLLSGSLLFSLLVLGLKAVPAKNLAIIFSQITLRFRSHT